MQTRHEFVICAAKVAKNNRKTVRREKFHDRTPQSRESEVMPQSATQRKGQFAAAEVAGVLTKRTGENADKFTVQH